MAVPAHDARDWDFANAFELPIRPVIVEPDAEQDKPFVGEGVLVTSSTPPGTSCQAEALEAAREVEPARKILESAAVARVIYVPRRIINLVSTEGEVR